MKKLILLFVGILTCQIALSQVTAVFEAPQNNASTTQVRAPSGQAATAYMRACALVLQNELTFMPANTSISGFGFTLSTSGVVSAPVAGNFTLYLQNTTDVSYLKGTAWSTILTGMTVCYASVLTIPLSTTSASVIVTLSNPFSYSGGGLYVAYDWFSAGPYSTTPATYLSESAILNPGCASASSPTAGPTSLTTTAFRPSFLFQFQNPYSNDARVVGVESPGRIAGILNSPHNIRAMVQNLSNTTLTNLTVSVNVAGANTFNNQLNIPSLAPGASTLVTFPAFNPSNPGTQTVTVTVPADQLNGNNVGTYLQQVTCDIGGQNPATNTFTSNSVGFGTGAGIIAASYLNPVTSTLTGLRGAISTNTAAVGNAVYGVLLSSTGAILATSSNVTITAAMLGTFANFNFPTAQNLTPATTYYLGFAQTAAPNAVAYFPAGTTAAPYLMQNLYYTVALAGGAPVLLAQNLGYFGIEAVFAHTVQVTAVSPTVSCGTSTNIIALSSTNYSWSTGSTASSITINVPTTSSFYTVTASNALGCTASRGVTLNVTPLAVGFTYSPSLICAGNSVSLSASGATGYTWTSASGTIALSTLTDTPPVNNSYTLSGANPNGCAASTIITLPVNPLPIVNLASTSASICVGNSVNLVGSGTAATYSWSTGQTTASVSVSPAISTIFTLTGSSAIGCQNSGTIATVVDGFTPSITSPTAICEGQSIQLQTTGASTLIWSTGSIFSSISVTPNITTTYSVTGKGSNNCQGSNQTTITVNMTPTVQAAITRSVICLKESAVLSASGAVSYSWNTGAATPSLVLTPTTTLLQTFTVVGQNAQGCSASAQISLKANTCAGIGEDDLKSGMQIYPNPGTGLYYLQVATTLLNAEVEIRNALGQLVWTATVSSENLEIDLSNQTSGYFSITLRSAEAASLTKKFIKQ